MPVSVEKKERENERENEREREKERERARGRERERQTEGERGREKREEFQESRGARRMLPTRGFEKSIPHVINALSCSFHPHLLHGAQSHVAAQRHLNINTWLFVFFHTHNEHIKHL